MLKISKLFLLCFFVLFLFSCSEEVRKEKQNSPEILLVGSWEAVSWEKFGEKRELPASLYRIVFAKNGDFTSFVNKKVVLKGKWILKDGFLSIVAEKNEISEKAEILNLSKDELLLFKVEQSAKFFFKKD